MTDVYIKPLCKNLIDIYVTEYGLPICFGKWQVVTVNQVINIVTENINGKICFVVQSIPGHQC